MEVLTGDVHEGIIRLTDNTAFPDGYMYRNDNLMYEMLSLEEFSWLQRLYHF